MVVKREVIFKLRESGRSIREKGEQNFNFYLKEKKKRK